MSHADSMSVLEERMSRIEAIIFGESVGNQDLSRPKQGEEDGLFCDSNLYTRVAQVSLSLPSSKVFETLVTQLDEVGLDSLSSIRNELHAPLSIPNKRTLVLANQNLLRQLARHGSRINALKPVIGGDSWTIAKGEMSKLTEAERNATSLIHQTAALTNKTDSLLETYDRTITKASEKLLHFHNMTMSSDDR